MAKRRRTAAQEMSDQLTGLVADVDQFSGLVRTYHEALVKLGATVVELQERLDRSLKRLGDLEAEHDALERRVAKIERGFDE